MSHNLPLSRGSRFRRTSGERETFEVFKVTKDYALAFDLRDSGHQVAVYGSDFVGHWSRGAEFEVVGEKE